jgi:hypothetical protein
MPTRPGPYPDVDSQARLLAAVGEPTRLVIIAEVERSAGRP